MTKRCWSETAVCRWLEQKRLRLLEGNYNTRFGEIYPIMTNGEKLVFVEERQLIIYSKLTGTRAHISSLAFSRLTTIA